MDYIFYTLYALIVLFISKRSTAESYDTTDSWDVISSCGQTIHVESDSGKLVLVYDQKKVCPPCDVTMTFGPRAGYLPPQIAVYFTRFRLAGCDADHVDVFDGVPTKTSVHDVHTSNKLNAHPLCGTNFTLTRAGNHFMTSRDEVTVSFTRMNPSLETAIFYMHIVLVYKMGDDLNCSKTGFYPCNKSLCVPKAHTCTQSNLQCKKDSHYCLGDIDNIYGGTSVAASSSADSPVLTIFIILGIIVLIAVLILILVCVVRNNCEPLFECIWNTTCPCFHETQSSVQVQTRADVTSNVHDTYLPGQDVRFNNVDQSIFHLPTYEEATETNRSPNTTSVFCIDQSNMIDTTEQERLPTYGESLRFNPLERQTSTTVRFSTSGYDRAPPDSDNAPPPYESDNS